MSYGSAPPPSGGVNPYGEVPEGETPSPYGTPPPPPPPPASAQPWQTPTDAPTTGYGTPSPPPPSGPSYGTPEPSQHFGGPAGRYSPYTAAGRYPGAPGAPGYGGWITSSRDNGKGTGALVMGIFSIVLCFGSLLGVGLGIGAIIMGTQGRKAVAAGTADNGGVATTGVVLGSIGVGLSALASLSYLVNVI